MFKRLIFIVMMAVWVVGCAGSKKVEKSARGSVKPPVVKEEDELTKRVRALKENLEGKEKGLSRLSESLAVKEQEKKQAAAKLMLAQKEIEDKEKEMALLRKFVENTKIANKEVETIKMAMDDITASIKKDQDRMQGKVDALKQEVDAIKNQIGLADKQIKEKTQISEKEKKESEAQLKRLEQEIAERQKAHLAIKTKREADWDATEKEKQNAALKSKKWNNQIRGKEQMITELMHEFQRTKKERDTEIETLKSKMEGVQKQADQMLQKTVEAPK